MANWAYSDSFTVGTGGVLINIGTTPGNGVIPNNIAVSSVVLIALPDNSGNYPAWQMKGMHLNSNWVSIPSDMPIQSCDSIGEEKELVWVKATSGSFTMSLQVKGVIS